MATCRCRPWKMDRYGYERTCRAGKRSFVASLHVWGGDVSVFLLGPSGQTEAKFPHVGPTCRIDEAKAYADRWLAVRCAEASSKSASLGGCGCRRGR